MIRELVNAQQVMHFVDRATPDTYDTDRALIVGVHARRLYAYRKQQWMTRDTAEKLLDAFDLGYLLYTGDIEVVNSEVKESITSVYKKTREHNRRLKAQRNEWRDRALKAEKLLQNPPSPPKCTCSESQPNGCKDSVKTLDVAVCH